MSFQKQVREEMIQDFWKEVQMGEVSSLRSDYAVPDEISDEEVPEYCVGIEARNYFS